MKTDKKRPRTITFTLDFLTWESLQKLQATNPHKWGHRAGLSAIIRRAINRAAADVGKTEQVE